MGFSRYLGLLLLLGLWGPVVSQAEPKIVVRLWMEEMRVGNNEICLAMVVSRVDLEPKTARTYTPCFPGTTTVTAAALKNHLVTRLGNPPFNFTVTADEIVVIGGLQ